MITDFGSLSLSMIGPEGGAVSVIDRLTAALDNIPDNLTNIFGDGGLLGKAITSIKDEFEGVGTAIANAVTDQIKEIFGGLAGSNLSAANTTKLIDQFKDDPSSLSADERTDLIRTLVNESAEKQGGFGAWMNKLAENSGLQALNDALNFEGTFYRYIKLLEKEKKEISNAILANKNNLIN